MPTLPEATLAATLILMRDTDRGAPELLVMERAGNMRFAAGALVFPGGKVDADDHVSAARCDTRLTDAAARIAAIRETVEEVGIATALRPLPDTAITLALRETLAGGESFSALLARHGLDLDLDGLIPFSRWRPDIEFVKYRFDTHFYIAKAPADGMIGSPDRNEAVRSFWATAAEILAEVDAGRARAIFPTRRNLERLACFASFEEARAQAESLPVQTVSPWIEERDGSDWLCIPEGIGYPVTAESMESVLRS